MPGSLITRTLSGARGLSRLPVARVLALAELAVLVREHMSKLEPHERRRLVELVRQGRGRPSSLSARERRELTGLVAKTEPRAFVNRAVQKVTGVPVSRGRRGRR
jgi:predicted ArsR family transcriptional regulator